MSVSTHSVRFINFCIQSSLPNLTKMDIQLHCGTFVAYLSLVFGLAIAPVNTKAQTVFPSVEGGNANSIENSVVKVFTTIRYPNVYKPWTKEAPIEATGSGVVIEGNRILTNAHVVTYAAQVQIQGNQAGDKISATVEAIDPGMDLAVLKLDSEKFFDLHPPLPRATTLPKVADAVMAYGYPKGGDSISITKGVVSRIEFSSYYFPVCGLRIQIDAAINPGNSGGPAMACNKMIGIAYSYLSDAQNVGYIIPCEEIELFLKDIPSGKFHGKPAMFDETQTLENTALRSFLKLDNGVTGVVVNRPLSSDRDYPLKKWDVITKIGDAPVDNQGMIKLENNLYVNFRYLVQNIARNGKLSLTVVRGGKTLCVELPVLPTRPTAISSLNANYPSYFIYGPLVFSTATTDLIKGYLKKSANEHVISTLITRGSSLVTRVDDKPAFEGEQLVVVPSPFFPHKISQGYGTPALCVVKSINGIPIKNLKHLVEVLRDARDEYITFVFDMHNSETLVFRRSEILVATDEILKDNGIPSQGSPDVLAIWDTKPNQ